MRRSIRASLFAALALVAAGGMLLLASGVGAASSSRPTDATVQRLLDRLVATPGGPVGAIVTLYRHGRTTVLRSGRADSARPGAPGLGDHMRIASITKAFTGAVALHLVQEGRLGLDDTIGQRLRGVMPRAWSMVTVREMLNHISGLPDYTRSDGFRTQAMTNPHGFVSPMKIIGSSGGFARRTRSSRPVRAMSIRTLTTSSLA